MARDDDYQTRLSVALNAKTPAYMLEWLAHDPNGIVRANAASHPHMPLAELERLVADHDEWVRINVAGNSGISTSLIHTLMQESSPRLLTWLATNMTTPRDIAWDLAQQHAEVCLDIATRTDLDEAMHAQIAPLALTLVLRESPPDALLRITLALASPLLPPAILAEHAERQRHWLPLYAIARNLNTPSATLQRLTQDANRFVRTASRVRQADA